MNANLAAISDELFIIALHPVRFISIIKRLQNDGFEFNGLCSRNNKNWPIGILGVIHGDEAVKALAEAGYRFDLDKRTLQYAETAFHGSVYRAVCLVAHQYNAEIEVPDIDQDTLAKHWEKNERSLNGRRDFNNSSSESEAGHFSYPLLRGTSKFQPRQLHLASHQSDEILHFNRRLPIIVRAITCEGPA